MRFGDLTGSTPANSRSARCSCEKRNEQICRVHNARPVSRTNTSTHSDQIAPAVVTVPLVSSEASAPLCQDMMRRRLLQLRGIRFDRYIGAGHHATAIRVPESPPALTSSLKLIISFCGGGSRARRGVGLNHETAERLGPRPMMFNPLRASSLQSAGARIFRINVSRLPAIDLIGASELFISWPIPRTSRCHALRSSSRNVRLRSVSTSNSCGKPVRGTNFASLPTSPNHPENSKSPAHPGSRPGKLPAPGPCRGGRADLSICAPNNSSPARFTSRSDVSGSK